MSNETLGKTIGVAVALCVICSIMVSTAAVKLKPIQEANKTFETKKNILQAAGLYDPKGSVDEAFKQISKRLVSVETGNFVEGNLDKYDQKKAAKDPAQSVVLAQSADIAKIKRRAKVVDVYLVEKEGQIDTIILPIYGKGLWSTMYAFLALEGDGNTVKGLTFYDHGETPGLGGEVDNPNWKALWPGKKIFGPEGKLKVEVLKGKVDLTRSGAEHQVDGLAGATLTTRGVSELIRFWLGAEGFGKFLNNLKKA